MCVSVCCRKFYLPPLNETAISTGPGACINRGHVSLHFISNIKQPPLPAAIRFWWKAADSSTTDHAMGPSKPPNPTALSQASVGARFHCQGQFLSFTSSSSFFGSLCFKLPITGDPQLERPEWTQRLKCAIIYFSKAEEFRLSCLWDPLIMKLMSKGPWKLSVTVSPS